MVPVIRGVLLDIAPPLVAYYGLRAIGSSEYTALLAATVLSGVKVAYDAVKARRLDPFAGYLLLSFGMSLAVALATTDPRLILAGNTLVNGTGGLLFLGSAVIGKPLTEVITERVHPDKTPPEADVLLRRRWVHVRLSAMWGVGLLVEVGVRLFVIAHTTVDVANGALTVISLVATAILLLATVLIVRRVQREQTRLAQG
jgi:uncharacterized membrane protein